MRSKIVQISVAVACSAVLLTGQTKVEVPSNKYTPEQDVQLGREAAEQARRQLPIMRDSTVTSYVETLGRRLVNAIPQDLRQPGFDYTFETVNVRDINAFALPGGPMFLNRGMIEAAKSEGEVASVVAHELSHVILRHGTAQASKATKYEIGTVAGAILGAIIGGRTGNIVAQTTQFGLGAAFMRFGRAFEKDADIEGAQIMARAGYDPREMANMFKTIEKQGGGGGPEFLSDHPNPGNRVDYINKEAATLRVENVQRDSAGFSRVAAYLRSLPKAPTTEEATAAAKRAGGSQPTSGRDRTGTVGPATGRVEPPSTRYTQYNEGDLFTVSVPSNWREMATSNAVTFAPEGGYGEFNGQSMFTHGVEFGISRNEGHDLRTATEELIGSLQEGNPRLGRPASYRRTSINGRAALSTTMANVSEVTGDEVIQLVTAEMRDGNLFYAVFVAPRQDVNSYQQVFQRVLSSIRFTN